MIYYTSSSAIDGKYVCTLTDVHSEHAFFSNMSQLVETQKVVLEHLGKSPGDHELFSENSVKRGNAKSVSLPYWVTGRSLGISIWETFLLILTVFALQNPNFNGFPRRCKVGSRGPISAWSTWLSEIWKS